MINIALAFTLLLAPDSTAASMRPLPQTPQQDVWLAEDKFRHAFMSLATVGFAYAGARTLGVEARGSVVLAVSVSALSGLGKEIYDGRHGTRFSIRDLAWDALGTALGAMLVAQVRE